MKKLFAQLVKFGLVGGLCFVIDFLITLGASALLRKADLDTDTAALVAGFFGFVISVMVNYFLSMKYVFARKEDMDRRKEFVVFMMLSVIGLGINELLLKGSLVFAAKVMAHLYENQPNLVTAGAKIIATAVVMVYNFVTRKIFLEKKEAK
ncbi:MAG: GtrA family protein [Lachnospiraceae bacterium]